MRMQWEPWRPEIVHSYIGGPTASMAPQREYSSCGESRPGHTIRLSLYNRTDALPDPLNHAARRYHCTLWYHRDAVAHPV